MMCDFYDSVVRHHESLQAEAAKKIPPEGFNRRRLRFWDDLKTLAKSLSEQQERLDASNE